MYVAYAHTHIYIYIYVYVYMYNYIILSCVSMCIMLDADYCSPPSQTIFGSTLGWNFVSARSSTKCDQLISIDFQLISIYFQFTVLSIDFQLISTYFKFTFDLLLIDFQLIFN